MMLKKMVIWFLVLGGVSQGTFVWAEEETVQANYEETMRTVDQMLQRLHDRLDDDALESVKGRREDAEAGKPNDNTPVASSSDTVFSEDIEGVEDTVSQDDAVPVEVAAEKAPLEGSASDEVFFEKTVIPPEPSPEEKMFPEMEAGVTTLRERFPKKKPSRYPEPRVFVPKSVKVSGEINMGIGVEGSDFYWKRANFDLNERNFRMISTDQLNKKENTYDPAIYDRFRLLVDTSPVVSPFRWHARIEVDPWSFTSKSAKTTVTGQGGDRAEIELLGWSNTGYTVNQIVQTLDNGDGFALPEMKIDDGRILPTTITSTFNNVFSLPEIKLNTQFQPIREFWIDYVPSDTFRLRVFPLAFEDQALSTDDPLRLSNNRIFWEESPWLARWKPGNFNSGGGDFTKGEWDDSLAFFTKDSDGRRLTALRGASLRFAPSADTTITATVATPKTLWQEYEDVEALPSSVRVKHFLSDRFMVGMVSNLHLGFSDREMDAYNYAGGLDGVATLNRRWRLEGQFSVSFSKQDITNDVYATKQRGNAYYMGVTFTTLDNEDLLRRDYAHLTPASDKQNYGKTRLYFARMDRGFQSSLSNYRETRDDSYWGRHLSFRRPLNRFFDATKGGGMSWWDVESNMVGDGIDQGRYVIGWNAKVSLWDGRLKGRTDIRNVHDVNNKFIENEVRTEWDYQTTKRWRTKLLLIDHVLPLTKGGIDPFIFDAQTGEYLINTAIADGEDPSLRTVSTGARYTFNDRLAWHGVWEYTNDITVGSDNYPRGLLNSSSFGTYQENGQTFRQDVPFLYSQGFFDLPPFEYHHVFRTGLEVRASDHLNVYLDYTRNPNKFAGQIDDNMNHLGVEMTYIPNPRWGMMLKYTWSRFYDLYTLVNDNRLSLEDHHNVFSEVRYKLNADDYFSLQYGVGPAVLLTSATVNPFGGSLVTVDTQHIIRLYYRKTF